MFYRMFYFICDRSFNAAIALKLAYIGLPLMAMQLAITASQSDLVVGATRMLHKIYDQQDCLYRTYRRDSR